MITDAGSEFLRQGLKDQIDLALERIQPHLVELRHGMWDAIGRTTPDAPRQAANSARELVDQLLKEGALATCATRGERLRYLMAANRGSAQVSDTDLEIANATWKLIDAEDRGLKRSVHQRGSPTQEDVRASIEAVERMLRLIFPQPVG